MAKHLTCGTCGANNELNDAQWSTVEARAQRGNGEVTWTCYARVEIDVGGMKSFRPCNALTITKVKAAKAARSATTKAAKEAEAKEKGAKAAAKKVEGKAKATTKKATKKVKETAPDLDSMDAKALKKLAADKGIDLGRARAKATIKAKIEAAL